MPLRMIATGGTIASTTGPDGRATVTLTGTDLVARLPARSLPEHLSVVDLPVAGSWNLGTSGAVRVAEEVGAALADGADGVVVTHGTDVLEETAWVLELLARSDGAALVLTGAMRHADLPDDDGPANLADALAVASDPAARGRGALVVLAGQVHHARYVVKAHASAPDAFTSPDHGPLGRVADGRVDWVTDAPVAPPAVGAAPAGPVPVVPSHWDVDGDMVDWLRTRGAVGLVVEATGVGNVNAALVPALERAVADDVPVVVATRCRGGQVAPVYGGPGGFAALADLGLVGSSGLTAGKARCSLQLLLSTGRAAPSGAVAAAATWFAELGGTVA